MITLNEIEIYQRNDQYIRINITENGKNMLLKDVDVCFAVSDGVKCVINKTLDDGITIIDDSVLEIHISSNDTNINSKYLRCELLLTDVDGNRYTVYQGSLNIKSSYAKEC